MNGKKLGPIDLINTLNDVAAANGVGRIDLVENRLVGMRLYKGNVNFTGRKSPNTLYHKDLASFAMTRYNPKDAEGFINLFALPVTIPQEDPAK